MSVPASIDTTGASDASAALNSFVASVPNGSVIVFPAGAVYRMNHGLKLSNRNNLVLQGNGATLRAYGSALSIYDSPITLADGNTDIAISDFTIEGNNTKTGTAIYGGGEDQQGIAIYGGARVEVADSAISKTWGDGVYANETTATHAWVDGLWVHGSSFYNIGRMGLTMNAVNHGLLEGNSFDQIGMFVLDFEPDTANQGATDVTFRNNTANVYGLTPKYTNWFVACANSIAGSRIDGITITGNTVTGQPPASTNTPNGASISSIFARVRMSHITFTNNTGTRTGKGATGNAVLQFAHVDGLTVGGNVQPMSARTMTSVSDSTTTSIH